MSSPAALSRPNYRATDRFTDHLTGPGYPRWREQMISTGGCTHPIRLSGTWAVHDATGTEVTSNTGHVLVPCGNRRESVCVACSDRYAADAFHLLRAGLSGGTKGVPDHVTERPRVFLTLTAPSFGPVRPDGQARQPGTYDYAGHVLFNASAGELWRRFTIAVARHLAKAAGIRVRDFADQARLSFAKVAEYQRRGAIHLHAVLRLDGPGGAHSPAPAWGSTDVLTDAIHAAHAQVRYTTPEFAGQVREFAWGQQIDVRPISAANASRFEDDGGQINEDQISSYVAKYATKGTGKSETPDRPIRSAAQIEHIAVNEHYKRLMRTAWNLGGPVPCPDCHPHGAHKAEGCGCENGPYCDTCRNGGQIPGPLAELKLRRWTHMLGFRGHFLTKSKIYSTTFGQIRDDRRQYRLDETLTKYGIAGEPVTVVNHWDLANVGYRTAEERELANAHAESRRAERQRNHATERKD
ncbi:replication initiator protein RepSA [Saccharopolyspora gloriosae]|uniref:Replication initiation protein n=1 Tax=Saccharopolyspora gloriosae TaxID=455344 RepID=A0A840NAZ4_9PSEU|nr:replication initiator [Saccharopolyspora gloriosae]MBB5067388.1 hypothetical protein [Saccharopolyspora gloriosae]